MNGTLLVNAAGLRCLFSEFVQVEVVLKESVGFRSSRSS